MSFLLFCPREKRKQKRGEKDKFRVFLRQNKKKSSKEQLFASFLSFARFFSTKNITYHISLKETLTFCFCGLYIYK